MKVTLSLREAAQSLVVNLIENFSVHPLIAPFLRTSRENPPQLYLHQHEVLARLAPRLPIRALIADEIGLGKTVTAIAVMKYLEAIGRVKRTLIIVPRVLVQQWRKELIRMGIPASRIFHLERSTIRGLEAQGFPEGCYIASMDLLKRERHLERVIDAPWDLIIVDEVHRFGHRTERFYNIGKQLIEAHPERNVLFLSATPHRGDARDYIERLKLLDPFLEDWRELDQRSFYEATHSALLFRRTKEDINNVYEGKRIFPPARFYACLVESSDLENRFVEELVRFLKSKLVELVYEKRLLNERVIPLLTVLVFKRASSSPYAAYTTMQRLLARRAGVDEHKLRGLVASVRSFFKIGYEEYEYEERDPDEVFNEFLEEASALLKPGDVSKIRELRDMAERIMKTRDTKLNALCRLLEWVSEQGFKAVVFTEYKDTLRYLYEQLTLRHPEWAKGILTLSSEETRNEEAFQKIKERFEKDPKAWLLIATDVVAEGVNLQVASILINYEIPWSLVKLEQRIGRVWRLGQKREVEVYTLFMRNVADEAALNAMYVKLLNLKRAELKPKPFTGEEILVYSEDREIFEAPPQVVVETRKGRKAFKRVTEYKTIQTFIKEGSKGLERLVMRILAAKQEIEKELKSKGVLYLPKTREEAERAPGALGFRNPSVLMEAMKRLVKGAAPLLGLTVQEREGGALSIAHGVEMPTTLYTLDDFFGLFRAKRGAPPVTIVSYGEMSDELLLLNVKVTCKGIPIYCEPVGVYRRSGRVLRGEELILDVSKALSSCIGVSEEDVPNLSVNLMALIESRVKSSLSSILSPWSDYRYKLVTRCLRDRDTWFDTHDYVFEFSRPFGCIKFVEIPRGEKIELPEEVKREIEKKAVELVLNSEREEGRIAEIVPESEHYDVKSIDPRSGEIRKIEVKGHAGPEIYGELTSSEAELARRERDSYWLYIVYDIMSGSPKLLRFRNPLETMNWREIEKVETKIEKRVILWPRSTTAYGEVGRG
ncbi:MAG: helicase-related protein [Thermofilaceae archaeon]